MTHDERIEKVARALHVVWIPDPDPWEDIGEMNRNYYLEAAEAALAAAGMEEMVREAARLTLYRAMSSTPFGEEPATTDQWLDDIVREVMGK